MVTEEATTGTIEWKGFLLQANRGLWEIKKSIPSATPEGEGKGWDGGGGGGEEGLSVLCEEKGLEEGGRR